MRTAAIALAALHLVRVGHFSAPVYATSAAADPGAVYVVEQAGRVRRLANGRVTTFLDLRSVVAYGGEKGLLSMAFAPDYGRSRLFYVAYTGRNGDDMVVRYGPGGPRTLLALHDPGPNDHGGQLQFGPGGHLYWSSGARILRLTGAKWQVIATGLHNAWRFSFDVAGNLYIGDAGEDRWEEVDYLPRGFAGVANFGWPHWEGNHVHIAGAPVAGRYVRPVAEYSHAIGCAVIGGYVWSGRYVFGDACSGAVFSLVMRKGRATDIRREAIQVEGLSSFGLDSAGRLYAMSTASGDLYRVS